MTQFQEFYGKLIAAGHGLSGQNEFPSPEDLIHSIEQFFSENLQGIKLGF